MGQTVPLPSRPRFLITRLSAVGDCIHTMPLVGNLRRWFPDSWISWITQRGPASLLSGYPGLDEVIELPRGWLKSPARVLQIRRELRERCFDVCLDPQGLTKSSLLAWLSGAGYRIGFASPQGRELSLWLNNVRIRPQQAHVVDRYLSLLKAIDAREPDVRFELPSWRHELIDEFLKSSPLVDGYAVLNPGAGWGSKVWPAESYGQLAAYLGGRHDLATVAVWSGRQERQWAEAIVAQSAGSCRLAPDTSLTELAELLRGSLLCVAADTGPLHLAAAVGTPCVGLYGPTLPERCGPYGPGHEVVQAYYQHGSCRHRRQATNDAMQQIRVETVQQACDRILSVARHSVSS